jgi:hypothetical protein
MSGLESCKEKFMPFMKSEAQVLLILGLLLPALAQAAEAPPLPAPREEMHIAQPGESAAPKQAKALSPDLTGAGMEPAAPAEATVQANMQEPPTEQVAGMGPSVALDTLDQHRGGSSVNSIKSEAVSNGLLQDATATNVATGNNTIADGAFSNAIGLPIVIQNSGANVLIQNSTIVNVQFR